MTTLSDYIEKYIKQTLAECTSGNKHGKLLRELTGKVTEIIKLGVSEVKHHSNGLDNNLEAVYDFIKSNKGLPRVMAKDYTLKFLHIHPSGKDIDTTAQYMCSINENELEVLNKAKDIVETISNINLLQRSNEGKEVNIGKILAHSIRVPHHSTLEKTSYHNVFTKEHKPEGRS